MKLNSVQLGRFREQCLHGGNSRGFPNGETTAVHMSNAIWLTITPIIVSKLCPEKDVSRVVISMIMVVCRVKLDCNNTARKKRFSRF